MKEIIESAFEDRNHLTPDTASSEVKEAVNEAIHLLDSGKARVAEQKGVGNWQVNEWLKKAVLLSFRLADNVPMAAGFTQYYDKVPSKYAATTEKEFQASGVRVVPPATARRGSYVAPNTVLMPSYVNIGAYVDSGTMVDTWATVGSCAQIGKNVHLSGGVGIGGVLEPVQAAPVIIEDDAFIGSRCIIVEGVKIEKEAVLGANVVLTSSTKIIDVSGDKPIYLKGYIPSKSVVIPGTVPKNFNSGTFNVPCALIIGKRKESTNKKTSLNDALREFNVSV